MIYSCFNQQRGLYRYFEDGRPLAVNADLPVPSHPAATKVGVPSLEAARPMPARARAAGEGWHARGIVVQCPNGPLSGSDIFGPDFYLRVTAELLTYAALGAVLGVGVMHALGKRTSQDRKTGAGVGALLGMPVLSFGRHALFGEKTS